MKRKLSIYFLILSRTLIFDHLMGVLAQHFTNIMIVNKRMKQTIRAGKIIDLAKKKGFTEKDKEDS